MKAIGLMSGTSGDGVDAALVQIRGTGHALRVTLLAFRTAPYTAALRHRILAAATRGTVSEICHLNAVLGEWFAKAALRVMGQAGVKSSDVQVIGSHGQTVHHCPTPRREPGLGLIRSTLQIAEPAVIAERTGITTVADFRPRDLAAGGQGAPLTPYVHYLLLRDPRRARLIVNLGGISNVTYLPASGNLNSVRAFDTGPGNMVLDALVHHLTHPFLRREPPKSTGREEFGETFLARVLALSRKWRLAPEDLLATCSLFTAMAVGNARRWVKGPVDEVIVAGGGVRNRTVMADLAAIFEPAPVRPVEELGWKSQAFEATAFAVLAYQTIHGECANVPAVTGAAHPVLLGTIVPGGERRRTQLR